MIDKSSSQITKVALGDTASIGSLLELGTYAVDVLKHLGSTPPASDEKPAIPSNLPLVPFSPKMTISAALQLLETTLVYGITQMAVCVVGSSDQHESSRQMEMDDGSHERDMNEKRRRPSAGVTNLARIEEAIVDLKGLLSKAKPVMDKAAEQLRLERYSLIGSLSNFLEKKVRTADGR